MKLKFIKLFLIILAISYSSAVSQEKIVYITKTGKKYHLGNCRSLRSSAIKITLSEARRRGYGPCKTCRP